MLAVLNPLVTNIKKELPSFGLNPADWKFSSRTTLTENQMTLEHRYDSDLQLAVKIKPVAMDKHMSRIEHIELNVLPTHNCLKR